MHEDPLTIDHVDVKVCKQLTMLYYNKVLGKQLKAVHFFYNS